MKLTQLQTLILALALLAAAVVLFVTSHDAPAALCLGAAIGTLTPTAPLGN